MPSSKDKNKNKGKDKSKDNNKDKTKDMGKEKSKGKGKEIYKEENQPLTISFTNSEKRSPSVERAVLKYARSDTRPFGHATVRSTPEHTGGNTWHSGGTNPDAVCHITVQFGDKNGKHITTKHIDPNGRGC